MYPGPANININAPAPQFPHPQIFPQPQQQFYPTAYPPHSAGPSPPIPTYVQPQGGQTYQAPQPHTPAPFKKPYLPLQRVEPQQLQYNHNGRLLFPFSHAKNDLANLEHIPQLNLHLPASQITPLHNQFHMRPINDPSRMPRNLFRHIFPVQ